MHNPLGASSIWLVSVSHATHVSPVALLIKMNELNLVSDEVPARSSALPFAVPHLSMTLAQRLVVKKIETNRHERLVEILGEHGFNLAVALSKGSSGSLEYSPTGNTDYIWVQLITEADVPQAVWLYRRPFLAEDLKAKYDSLIVALSNEPGINLS